MTLASLPIPTLTAHFAGGDADISAVLRNASWSITRGTESLSLTNLIADAGSFRATLANRARALDPSFTTGPHFGDLVPGVPMTFQMTWPHTAGTVYDLFNGTNTQWPQIYPAFRADQITQIACADAVRQLASAQLTSIFPTELSGDRIQAILDDTGFAGASILDNGTSRVPFFGDGLSSSSAWSMMSDACAAEWGALWIDAAGNVQFADRNTLHTFFATSQATFGDAHSGGELPFADVIVGYDDSRIVNDADLIYDRFGTKAHAEDLTSQGQPWGKLSWQQNFPVASGMLARSYVHEVVRRHATPTVRIEKVVVKPQNSPTALWPKVLGLDIGDRITVKVTPMGGGSRIVKDVFIRGINHEYSNNDWVTTYTVDDGDLDTVTFYLDGTTPLDGTHRLSF